MRGCTRARQWIDRAVDGELSIDERFRLDAHLEVCATCRTDLAALEQLEAALAGSTQPPVDSLDLDRAVVAVRAGIEAGMPGTPDLPELIRAGDDTPFDLAPPAEQSRRAPRALQQVAAVFALAATLLALIWLALRDPAAENGVETNAPRDFIAEETSAPTKEEASDAPANDLASDAVVPERLEQVREEVAHQLAMSWQGIPLFASRSEILGGAERFEEATQELARDWPLVRIVQGLVESDDEALAGSAIRYLGLRGDAIAGGGLRDALERPALGAAAVLALGDLGFVGLAGLEEALERPELAGLATDHLVTVGGPQAAGILGAAIERGRGTDVRPLLVALAAMDPPPVSKLLSLARDNHATLTDVLDALRGARGAGSELGELVASGDRRFEPELLLAALAELRPAKALPWIEERAAERRTRESALACIVAYRNAEGLEVLVRLRANGRLRGELIVEAATDLITAAPEAAVDLARRYEDDEERSVSGTLLSLLLETEVESIGEALTVLAFSRALSDDERLLAALAIGELGTDDSVPSLIEGMRALTAGKERLAAACLISANAIGGADAVGSALATVGKLSTRNEERVLALLAESEAKNMPAVTLYKVARELEPFYDTKNRRATGAL